MSVKVGINGFGRIGRNLSAPSGTRARTSTSSASTTSRTRRPGASAEVRLGPGSSGRRGRRLGQRPLRRRRRAPCVRGTGSAQLPWKEVGAEIVVESTSLFTDREKAAAPGSRRPEGHHQRPRQGWGHHGRDGRDDDVYDPTSHHVISNASCTTNCVVPLAKVLEDSFGIDRALMTTVHAYTNDQNLLDLPHKDLRRARAAAIDIVPASTGAAKATSLALPQLKGRWTASRCASPCPMGRSPDLVAIVNRDVTVMEVNDAYRAASETDRLKGKLVYTEDPSSRGDIEVARFVAPSTPPTMAMGTWSRSWVGTTTSGGTRTAWSTS